MAFKEEFMNQSKHNYPRIIQIMPCENMWFRYSCAETGVFFYSRVHCLALMETKGPYDTIYRDVRYIDSDSTGIFYEEPNYESIWHCKFDLTEFTHSLEDERNPSLIFTETIKS